VVYVFVYFFFFFNDTVTSDIYTLSYSLSLHYGLPICVVIGLGMDALHHGRFGSEALLWRPLKRSGVPAGGVERLGWKAQDIRDGFRLVAKTR
jgi:hypothetical protein